MKEAIIPYGRQDIREDDIAAVTAVLRSDWLTQGETVPAFEAVLARQCRAKHAVAVNSATSALHIACLALEIGPGDLVWTSPITFVATANCARFCGADVDFVDIDPATHNMSVAALAEKLIVAERAGRLPKLVIAVHFSGRSCDMRAVRGLADCYGFRIVEDAAHAIGGTYEGEPIGNCRYSDIAVLSFHPVKIITTGEGGAALTNDPVLADHMARLRSHGMTREPALMEGPSEGPWYYQMLELGWNYRLTDIQAALGISQMTRLGEYVERRVALALRYADLLEGLGLALPTVDTNSAWHLYVIGWNEQARHSRSEAFVAMREARIGVNVHYIPVHLQPYYRRLGFGPGQYPHAEAYYARAMTLPLYATLTDAQQDRVVQQLRALVLNRPIVE